MDQLLTSPQFDNSYSRLPERFFVQAEVAPASDPQLIAVNDDLASELGVSADWLRSDAFVDAMAGRKILEGSAPLAMAYAGHQFGHFSPQLGDGRAVLLGEIVGPQGTRFDLQVKGSGRTPFSRGGDGNAALGPVVREYIMSEAMHALGVPTTRSLAMLATGDAVQREQALPGARLLRVAQSHVRVGTFQYFAAQGDVDAVRALTSYMLNRHFPEHTDDAVPALRLLEQVAQRQAMLIAQWQSIGFIHGVMNTDNSSISGETIDYGPCAFMDQFNPAQVYSSIDRQGRYAYSNQPAIGNWNLIMLAQALLPLIDENQDRAVELAQAAVDGFADQFEKNYASLMGQKLGFVTSHPDDGALIANWFKLLAISNADMTNLIRRLSAVIEVGCPVGLADDASSHGEEAGTWLSRWRARLAQDGRTIADVRTQMDAINPAYIPRNHLVEAAIAAAYMGDFEPFETLNNVLKNPFIEQAGREIFALPPRPEEVVSKTFCGT